MTIKFFLSIVTCILIAVYLLGSKSNCNTRKGIAVGKAQTFVIIGNAAAGQGAVKELNSLIQRNAISADSTIVWISIEKEVYDKTRLADYVSNQQDPFNARKLASCVSYLFGKKVVKIDKEQKFVLLDSGERISYDKLFLGIGTTPYTLNIPGINAKGVCQFYTFTDAALIKNILRTHTVRQAVILGTGLNGLECADTLHKCGVRVSIINRSKHVLSKKISGHDAEYIEKAMVKKGIRYYPEVTVQEIIHNNDIVTGVYLSDGTFIPADMFVYIIGGAPNAWLAKQAGLKIHDEAIIVDDYMRTSDPDIYASGDCVVVKDRVTGELVHSEKWGDAEKQGALAARSMAGIDTMPYKGTVIASRATVFGMKIMMSGPVNNPPALHKIIIRKKDDSYYKFLFESDRLKGFFIINPDRLSMLKIRKALISQDTVSIDYLLSWWRLF